MHGEDRLFVPISCIYKCLACVGFLATLPQMRAKLLLLLSYLVSLGAIAGAVTLLVQAQQHGKDMWVGAVSTRRRRVRGGGEGWRAQHAARGARTCHVVMGAACECRTERALQQGAKQGGHAHHDGEPPIATSLLCNTHGKCLATFLNFGPWDQASLANACDPSLRPLPAKKD